MSYRASDGTRQWDGSKKVPEERMAVRMQSFARTGITPDIAGADLSYALKLQYEEIKLQVAKNVSTPTYAGFSIKKIECKTCGGSFDGSHQRTCPFCQNVYDMKEEGWVITKIGEVDD